MNARGLTFFVPLSLWMCAECAIKSRFDCGARAKLPDAVCGLQLLHYCRRRRRLLFIKLQFWLSSLMVAISGIWAQVVPAGESGL
jgi:hypothetical protein